MWSCWIKFKHPLFSPITTVLVSASYIFNTEAHPIDPGIVYCCSEQAEMENEVIQNWEDDIDFSALLESNTFSKKQREVCFIEKPFIGQFLDLSPCLANSESTSGVFSVNFPNFLAEFPDCDWCNMGMHQSWSGKGGHQPGSLHGCPMSNIEFFSFRRSSKRMSKTRRVTRITTLKINTEPTKSNSRSTKTWRTTAEVRFRFVFFRWLTIPELHLSISKNAWTIFRIYKNVFYNRKTSDFYFETYVNLKRRFGHSCYGYVKTAQKGFEIPLIEAF